jgi:prostaglandin-E synthase
MEKGLTAPNIKFAQRKDRIYITIDIVDVSCPIIDIIDNTTLTFSGTKTDKAYFLNIEFFDEVVKMESKFTLNTRNIFLNIKKKQSGPFWPRIFKENTKHSWLTIDWQYYIDEDDDEDGSGFLNTQNNFCDENVQYLENVFHGKKIFFEEKQKFYVDPTIPKIENITLTEKYEIED